MKDIKLLEKLSLTPGVPGREHRVRDLAFGVRGRPVRDAPGGGVAPREALDPGAAGGAEEHALTGLRRPGRVPPRAEVHEGDGKKNE